MANVEEVQAILLADEGWCWIEPGSMVIEQFEPLQAGRSKTSQEGFRCKLLDTSEGAVNVAGPLSALRAVRF